MVVEPNDYVEGFAIYRHLRDGHGRVEGDVRGRAFWDADLVS